MQAALRQATCTGCYHTLGSALPLNVSRLCRLHARALGSKTDPWMPPYAVWDFSTGNIYIEPA